MNTTTIFLVGSILVGSIIGASAGIILRTIVELRRLRARNIANGIINQNRHRNARAEAIIKAYEYKPTDRWRKDSGLIKDASGFSLIELLVCVSIIAILAVIIIPVSGGVTDAAKKAAAPFVANGKVEVTMLKSLPGSGVTNAAPTTESQ